jgi:hypothetical protein
VAVASGPTERSAAAALEAVADVALLEGDLPTSLDAYEAVTALATPTDLAELADAPANQALALTYMGNSPAGRVAAERARSAARASTNPDPQIHDASGRAKSDPAC